jgi:hypothetical protein
LISIAHVVGVLVVEGYPVVGVGARDVGDCEGGGVGGDGGYYCVVACKVLLLREMMC